MRQKYKSIFILFLFILSGFIRESFFRKVNSLIKSNNRNYSDSWVFLDDFSTSELQNIKWVATFLFTFLFLALTIWFVHLIFKEKKYLLIVLLTYGGVILLSGCALLFGKIFMSYHSLAYYFSRWLMGAAQSPLLPAILILLIYYSISREKKYRGGK